MPRDFFLLTTCRCAPNVAQAVRSIALQYPDAESFRREAMVLVLDDCSDDESPSVARCALEALGARFDVDLAGVNVGSGAQHQRGLEWLRDAGVRRGDTATFLDGNDLLLSGAIHRRRRALQAGSGGRPLHCVGGQSLLLDQSPWSGTSWPPADAPGAATSYALFDGLPTDPAVERIASLFESTVYASNASFDAEALLRSGARFPDCRIWDDWLFFMAFPQLRRMNLPEPTLIHRCGASDNAGLAPMDLAARETIHALWLDSLGVRQDRRASELLNTVSYLVFSFSMDAAGSITRETPDLWLPWFASRALAYDPAALRWHGVMRDEVSALFDAIVAANAERPAYSERLLRSFLGRLLVEADRRVDAAQAVDVNGRCAKYVSPFTARCRSVG
jgi:hypothetical protein